MIPKTPRTPTTSKTPIPPTSDPIQSANTTQKLSQTGQLAAQQSSLSLSHQGQPLLKFTRNLNAVARVVMICFVLVAGALTYWNTLGAATLTAQDFNPRLVESERAIQRGSIYDRAGNILAQSVELLRSRSGQAVMLREYLHPEAATALGYYSLNYGTGGVEAAFDTVLRGEITPMDQLLHRPQVGADVQVTFDLALQNRVIRAFDGNKGAAIVIDVPSGAVLAMVSLPSFNPNQLDSLYAVLSKDTSAPLLNRVTQGVYQPGGALQTILMAYLLSNKTPLDQAQPEAALPVKVGSLTLGCAIPITPQITGSELSLPTLKTAYANACPAPFAAMGQTPTTLPKLQEMLSAFGLLNAPTLSRFATIRGKLPTPLTAFTDAASLQAQLAGQGDLTVTPLQMALVAAIIANHGNTITPYLVEGTSEHGANDWQPINYPEEEKAIISEETAAKIRDAMRLAVTDGAAKAAATGVSDPNAMIYGHASIAYTGTTANSWFIGFIQRPDGHMVVTAIVLEGQADPAIASAIAGQVFK